LSIPEGDQAVLTRNCQPILPFPHLTLSVIVPVYNGGERLRRCLLSLAHTDPSPDEIIVVSDGDTDGSWRVSEELGARVLRMSKQEGPARARNEGAKAAQGELLLFLDADVTVPQDIVSRISETFQENPDLTALIGSYDDTPEETNFLSQYKNLFHHYTHQTSREEASTFWGACGAIRTRVFMELGGFDEGYRQPSIEDIDLGYRLKGAGYRIRLHKGLQIKHLKRWEPFSLLKSDFFHRALPWTELILRNHCFINDLNFRGSSRLSVMMVWGLLATLAGTGWRPESLAITGALTLSLLILNLSVYRFFFRKRGFGFTLKVIPWHWLYYLYSGLAFALGSIQYLLSGERFRRPHLPRVRKEFPGRVKSPEQAS